MGTLSVKENFHFSAALRLPSSVSASERSERVDSVVQELGLVHCADTKVSHFILIRITELKIREDIEDNSEIPYST